jgi:rhamnosyltransferase
MSKANRERNASSRTRTRSGGSKGTIAGIVVTFAPDAAFRGRLKALASQVDTTIVVDNSEDERVQQEVRRMCVDVGCQCITNACNLGIAEALNQGIQAALPTGAKYVLTMDQDSTPAANMVVELERTRDDASRAGLSVGVVAPVTADEFMGPLSAHVDAVRWSVAKLVITSGSLIPVAIFKSVGLFRAGFFIDGVDQEFCLRIRRYGYRVVRAHAARLEHRLGTPSIHNVFGAQFIPTNHSPTRRFFMGRNIVWMVRLFLFSDTITVTRLALKLMKNGLLIAAFEDQKMKKLRAIAKGLVEGIRQTPATIPSLQ